MTVTLENIKNALGITGDYQDATLQVYFDEVVDFLLDAGVSKSNMTAGVITRGVADLWNYGSGDGELSPYFLKRAAQLSFKS